MDADSFHFWIASNVFSLYTDKCWCWKGGQVDYSPILSACHRVADFSCLYINRDRNADGYGRVLDAANIVADFFDDPDSESFYAWVYDNQLDTFANKLSGRIEDLEEYLGMEDLENAQKDMRDAVSAVCSLCESFILVFENNR